jgi:hypothetical protein
MTSPERAPMSTDPAEFAQPTSAPSVVPEPVARPLRAPQDAVVTYLAGSGRSGSTLLDRLLGQSDGVVAIGELVYLWEPDQLDRHVCGCGTPVRDCPFWSAVAERAFGGWDSPGYHRLVELRAVVLRHRYLLFHLAPALRPGFRAHIDELSALLVPVYNAIAEVAGVPVVVDSSKEIVYGYALHRALGGRLRIIHLIRNGQGVAYSWTKQVAKPEIGNPEAALDRYRPGRMAARWVGYNLALEMIRLLGVKPLIVHYEDVVDHPVFQLNRILGFSDRAPREQYDHIGPGVVELTPSHTVAGNPMRFRQGTLPLRRDEAWRSKMPPRDRRLVAVIAGPLLWRFGYLGSKAKRAGRTP